MRQLATIRVIREIKPINGADMIELAIVDGWQCVVKKDEFKVGDLAVYFEIDSFLPCVEPFLFLESKGRKKNGSTGNEGYRLKTIKLKGELSQGLLLPISSFPQITANIITNRHSIDFNELLGVELYVELYEATIPASLQGKVKGNFPSFIPKTDEDRIQNNPKYFELFDHISFEMTEKLDGTSCTAYFNNGVFGICSRNMEMDYKNNTGNLYVKTILGLELDKILKSMNKNVALQGEIVGVGIQKNRLKLSDVGFYLFNIYNIDEHRYMLHTERMDLFDRLVEKVDIRHVPILDSNIRIFDLYKDMDTMLMMACGLSYLNPKAKREGIVLKSNILDAHNDIISFKVISNEYLLSE